MKVLYLVTSPRPLEHDPLFDSGHVADTQLEVVLLQEAVTMTQVPASAVSVLADDLRQKGVSSPFSIIGYRELLEKIFAADRIIRL